MWYLVVSFPDLCRLSYHGMVWCDWVGYDVVWCGMVWYGKVSYGMVWCYMMWCGRVSLGMECY